MTKLQKRNIIKDFLGAFNCLSGFFSRFYDSLKFSIKTKINAHYITVIIFAYVFSLLALSFLTISIVYISYNIEAHDDVSLVASILESDLTNYDKKIEKLMNEKNIKIEVNHVSYDKEDTGIINYFPKSFFDDKLTYKDYINIKNKKYLITIVYDIYSYSSRLMDFLLIVSFGYLICLMFVTLFGTTKIKNILSPIFDMTKTANEITTNNLDVRIDVENTKYELKDLSITLNKMLDRLSDEYSKQKKFVSDVSHELRTPISVIHGYSNMLSRWAKEDEMLLEESVDAIKKEAENMSDLVSKLLFIARSDNETLIYNKTKINISKVLEELIKESKLIDEEKHIIEGNIIPDIYIYADEKRIKQLFRVFIDNSLKYTPEGLKINLEMKINEYAVIISIKDEGIGIKKEDIDKIFNRFYRSDESRNRQTGGHGLGLSIASLIVESHKGDIKVKSKEGKGSEFIIKLMKKK